MSKLKKKLHDMIFEEAKPETEEYKIKRRTFIRRATTVLFFLHVYLAPACWVGEGKDSPMTVLGCMMLIFYGVVAIVYHDRKMRGVD